MKTDKWTVLQRVLLVGWLAYLGIAFAGTIGVERSATPATAWDALNAWGVIVLAAWLGWQARGSDKP